MWYIDGKDYTDEEAIKAGLLTPAQMQAYRALETAAWKCHDNMLKTKQYHNITQFHRDVVDAMPAVLKGTITPEEAMALLWTYDGLKERGLYPETRLKKQAHQKVRRH